MKKTAQEWFQTLKEPMRSDALQALEQWHFDPKGEMYNSLGDALVCCFDWEPTSQGYYYWLGATDCFLGLKVDLCKSKEYAQGYTDAQKCDPSAPTESSVEQSQQSLIDEIRTAVADYMRSEGCSCCQDVEAHNEAMQRLGNLLGVPNDSIHRGIDFSQYRSKP